MAAGSNKSLAWTIHPRQLLWKLSDTARQARERTKLTPEAAFGKRGEDLAHRYLRSKGMTILSRNYRPGEGDVEVDLVARDGEKTVFIEVKTRTSTGFSDPERTIGTEKRKHIVLAAHTFATRAGVDWDKVRFDTVSVVLTAPPTISHQQDAWFERPRD